MWFYLPLMHSEDLETHELAVAQYTQMGDDFRALQAQPSAGVSDQDRWCGKVLAENKEAAQTFLQNGLAFERKHQDIIVKFGRYPHRNAALGRDSTPEEQQYLDNGGETFSAADREQEG